MTFTAYPEGFFLKKVNFQLSHHFSVFALKQGTFLGFNMEQVKMYFSARLFQKACLCNDAFETCNLTEHQGSCKTSCDAHQDQNMVGVFFHLCSKRTMPQKSFYKKPVILRRNLRQAKRIRGFAYLHLPFTTWRDKRTVSKSRKFLNNKYSFRINLH